MSEYKSGKRVNKRKETKAKLRQRYFEMFPNETEEPYSTAIKSGDTTPFFNQERTLTMPGDTINYNTSQGVYNEYPGDMDGFYLGMNQHNNPRIVGSSFMGEDNYRKDVDGKDWGNINQPFFFDGPQNFTGDSPNKLGTFKGTNAGGEEARYKVKRLEDFPHLYERYKKLGY
tara:strand:+ start:753 stop:1268 length:516 start_codon:yes stop_codon:yes gene_type:complete